MKPPSNEQLRNLSSATLKRMLEDDRTFIDYVADRLRELTTAVRPSIDRVKAIEVILAERKP